MTSLIGQTINSRYRLDSLLGDGGMGTVFRAFDHNLDRQIAIKLMHGHFARQPEFRRRLIQEAQTAAKLDHPSIVRIYDFGESELGLFIAMEFVDGGSLREHLQRLQRLNRYLPFSQSLQIGIQIAEALDYAHRRGVVHRDVKPGNIILKRLSNSDEPGEQPFRALLTDFGLVKLQEGSPMTQSGATVGTPAYMSPEQCEGVELDGRTDLYSLGIVLYELVTNRLPFAFQSLADAISTHRRGTRPAPPSEYRADAPPLIDSLLAKSLAKNPNDRFADGYEMAAALRSASLALAGDITRVMVRQELDILDQVENPPEGYELQINAPGHPPSVMALANSVITVGRFADNDIVLPAEGVSRHHARLQATSLGWEVYDLGGVNGTWVNDRRLRPEEATPLPVGSSIKVGPYELVLHGPDTSIAGLAALGAAAAIASVPGGTTRPVDIVPEAPAVEQILGLYAVQDTVTLTPGEEGQLVVEVINRGTIADRVGLQIQGIPAGWITTPLRFISIPPGESAELSVGITAPVNEGTPTGRQRVRTQLVSQRHPEIETSVAINLVVNSFFAFSASLDSDYVHLPGTVTVSVRNVGTEPGYVTILPRDPQDALDFSVDQGRIPIEPNQTAKIPVGVKVREAGLFKGSEVYPYEVNVVSRAAGRQQLTAEGETGSIIPVWLLYALIFICTFSCAALAIAGFINRDRIFGPSPTATIPFAGLVATQTSAAITQTAVAISGTQTISPTVSTTVDMTATALTATAMAGAETTATWAAATAASEGDSDGDGLSNAQEALIGTDPFNPDTDGDRLGDGQEVLVHGTNPLHADSDMDTFSDGREVLELGSDPLNPNDPISQKPPMPQVTVTRPGGPGGQPCPPGQNCPPCPPGQQCPPGPPTWTPTRPTWTPPPTWTPTQTKTPVTPVTNTPTWTPSATWTPTQTPTITPSPTATATATLTPSPTATDTPDPGLNPSIACSPPVPVIDGTYDPATWPGSPFVQFSAQVNPARQVTVYYLKSGGALNLALLMNDPTIDSTDSVRILFDTTNNGGDPDSSDRYFEVFRDGSSRVWAGIGSNADGLMWDTVYSTGNWDVSIGETTGQWVVEMNIGAGEMPGLANPFGQMIQANFSGDLATWPSGADGNSAGSWRDVNNPGCS